VGYPDGSYSTADIDPTQCYSITEFCAVLHVTLAYTHYEFASFAGLDVVV
jgi:hypothetical protein